MRYSDPRWVRTIARGANLIMWSVIAFVAMILLGIVVSLVLAENHAYVPDILPIIFQLLLLLPAVFVCGGCLDRGQSRRPVCVGILRLVLAKTSFGGQWSFFCADQHLGHQPA